MTNGLRRLGGHGSARARGAGRPSTGSRDAPRVTRAPGSGRSVDEVRRRVGRGGRVVRLTARCRRCCAASSSTATPPAAATASRRVPRPIRRGVRERIRTWHDARHATTRRQRWRRPFGQEPCRRARSLAALRTGAYS